MKRCSVRHESTLPVCSRKVWEWLLCPASFERTIPPWMAGFALEKEERIDRFFLKIPYGFFSISVQCKICFSSYEEGLSAVVEKGPFRFGKYSCKVFATDPSTSFLEEEFVYELPFFLSRKKIRKKLKSLFVYRHRAAERDLLRYEKYAFPIPLRVLISGSSGLVGASLGQFLRAAGHEVVHLHRGENISSHHSISWDPQKGTALLEELEGFDAVIHLAGESLAKGLWTFAKKRRILESRKTGTEHLVSLLYQLKTPPKTFISASAVGYYGSSSAILTESSPSGSTFLSHVCEEWEKAASPLERVGVRVVLARLGLVISPRGGLLRAILPIFRLGCGAKMGHGKQKMPWISLEDTVGAIYHILASKEVCGPVNVVSPSILTQKAFAKIVAKVLHKPCFLSIPTCLLRGEKAKELLLISQEVAPCKLLQSGFSFIEPELQSALQSSLPS